MYIYIHLHIYKCDAHAVCKNIYTCIYVWREFSDRHLQVSACRWVSVDLRHDSFISGTWPIHVCDTTYSHLWHHPRCGKSHSGRPRICHLRICQLPLQIRLIFSNFCWNRTTLHDFFEIRSGLRVFRVCTPYFPWFFWDPTSPTKFVEIGQL